MEKKMEHEMETGIVIIHINGWLSKLGIPFGYPKYYVPYYTWDPKQDHHFDNT